MTDKTQTLYLLANKRHKTQAQKEEFFEEMEVLLKGSPFFQILEGFSRQERIDVLAW